MFDSRNDSRESFDGVLMCSVNMGRVHINSEKRGIDFRHRPQRGRRVINRIADVRLDTEDHTVPAGHLGQASQTVNGLLQRSRIAAFAAGTAVHDRNTDLSGGLERRLHGGGVL